MVYDTTYQPLGKRHLAFAGMLIAIILLCILTAAGQSGPIILGSELNTNGQVEYMCLGNGCDNYRDFHWVD